MEEGERKSPSQELVVEGNESATGVKDESRLTAIPILFLLLLLDVLDNECRVMGMKEGERMRPRRELMEEGECRPRA
jgi:hypothetical protein